ncbi:MAG: amidohydrolase [Aminobacterium sp.]|jgi:imidazolonepropionase-like amidohydrolase|uniref:amidohydrolase n=1 Tax=unclassified Aminobacterium TaxID=2685012 RepID=UPI001BD03EF8|nr:MULTISPECIES: amidohydrolase [unclassified Aminobacterium]MDD2206009.1 amidohydrolase [Aminobacterium sp.]MDD3425878.1 amidohydrolase [Aminobacterium sp.]MDD3707186.1 amidohydrolase [Aminobacterium sp.]MDD4227834.1 amidohydrolase [Aminobacterium sp.]MDD4550726.1 amidohydrolase [Aminobacterium sp.]
MKAIIHATIETMTGKPIENGTVLFNESEIVSVGESLTLPSDVEIIDGTGMYVTPGLIDAHTHLGAFIQGYPESMSDGNEMTNPLTPQLRILDAIYQDDPGFSEALSGGVTCVQILPGSANVIGGEGAIVKTCADVVDRMVVRAPSGMKAALGENPVRVYGGKTNMPMTRMANASLMRQALNDAHNYQGKKEQAEKKGEFFEKNLGMEALLPVINRELPLRIHCHRSDDIATAIRIAEEFNILYTIEHCTEGHLIASYLAEKNIMAAIGPTLTGKPKLELKNASWQTLTTLYNAGVHFCIITDHPVIPIDQFYVCAALAFKAGLPRDIALKAITIFAAEHLGIADKVGTLEKGKDADIVLWDGDPLDVRSHVLRTFIEGREVYSKE